MDRVDHVALVVKNLDETVKWYLSHFNARLIYQDDTWAMVEFANVKLAFVVSHQHPAHIAFSSDKAESYGKLNQHRDGSLSCYAKDPSGNMVEFIKP